MTKHMTSCAKRNQRNLGFGGKYYLLKASAGPFFIYFEISESSTLEDVDSFLRDVWLKCCGHLSAFTINGVRYSSYVSGSIDNEQSMDKKLSEVLSLGLKSHYEYDFGTTTELEIKVIEERVGRVAKVVFIARNTMPCFRCSCGKTPTAVCTQCNWVGKGFLCEQCSKQHECGDDMLLPVVNSPRMGMCGYTG